MSLGCPQCGSVQTGVHKPGCTWEADHPTAIEYEYAGFKYLIVDKGGDDITVTAVLYQHPHSKLDKHIRAARETYKEDKIARPHTLRTKP